MTGPERFYAIRLADGDLIYGLYSWLECDGPADWTVAEEADHDDPTEYEIVRMSVEPVARRTFGVVEHTEADGECDFCGEPWPCQWFQDFPESLYPEATR